MVKTMHCYLLTQLFDHRRVSRMIYGMLHRQQSTLDKLEKGEISGNNTINMAVISRPTPELSTAVIEAQLVKIESSSRQSTGMITKPTKLLPRRVRFGRWGFSAYLVALPKDDRTNYTVGLHISLMGKMYSVQLRMASPTFSPDPVWQVRNIVPVDSEMAMACRIGDFNRARQLLTSGLAHGSDVTDSGWPMLEVGIPFKLVWNK
jgi:hypothetical protein